MEPAESQSVALAEPPQHAHGSDKNLSRKFLKNTVALAFGWNLNAVIRLVAAGVVVRKMGVEVFGGYALLVVWLTIAEWILDFGTVEVFVREANQEPEHRDRFVRIFLALKIFQAPLAWLVLATGLFVMQYPKEILAAGIFSGISLFFTSMVVLCRATFKASLKMEREVFSEFISVVVMVPAIFLVAHLHWGLIGVMGTYVFSRAVFCIGCLVFGRNLIDFSIRGLHWPDIRWGAHASFAIGLIGFVVVVYQAADLLVLSRTASLSDVAVYSAALRFTLPLTMALNAIAVSLYPVLSLLKSPERFHQTCQHALDTTLLLGGYALVVLWGGAEFFMSLLGKQLVFGSNALRILAIVCVIKAISMVIGPTLFLVRAQRYALGYMIVGLLLKIAVIAAASLRAGYIGAALGSLSVEVFFLTPVTMYYVRRFTGFQATFGRIWKLVPLVIGVAWLTRIVVPKGNITGAILAALLYPALLLGLRIIKTRDLQMLLKRS
jgi:O-antigen/teichoic acid export membrane protein